MPPNQPMTGIMAWNRPKCQARRKVWRLVTILRATPAAMATAKASMARATDTASISIKGMGGSGCCVESGR